MPLHLNKLSSLQLLQVLRFGALFLSSVIIAKLIGDTNIVGRYENLVLVGSSFTFFWVSGLINTFIPFYQKTPETERKNLISTTFILLSALALFFGLIGLSLKAFLYEGTYAEFLLYLVFAFFTAPAFLTEYIYLSVNKPKNIALYAIAISFLHVASAFLPLWLGHGMNGVLICLAAFGVIRYVFTAWLVLKTSQKFLFHRQLANQFLKASLPVAASLLIGGSMLYIDSYLVRFNFNSTQFAIFQYGARELPFVLLMANALSNIGSAEVAFHYKNGNIFSGLDYLKQKSLRLMHFLFPLSFILLIFSEPLFSHLYADAYIPAARIFDIYILLIISRLIFPQTILLAMHQNITLLWSTGVEWFIKICLNTWFLYFFGLPGIAYATVVAYLSEKLIHIYFLSKHKLYATQYIPMQSWLIYSALLIITYAAKYLIYK